MSLFYKKSRDIFFYNRQVSKGWYFMLRFLIRGVVGTGCISLISFVLTLFGIVIPIGMNVITFFSCAFLGFRWFMGCILFRCMSDYVVGP